MRNKLLARLIIIRRAIHQYPELGNREFRTAVLIEKTLKGLGIKIKRIAKTGVVGILEGSKRPGKGKVIAFRADMDALPIEEKTNKPYASRRKGIMHACGHDANTAMVLGSAMILSREKKNFTGTVKFIFQPNEESSGGAKEMIRAGVLRKPSPDAIIGIHVNPWLKSGLLGLKRGAMMAAVDKFTIEVFGEGGHGAYPNFAKDSIVIMSQIINALQTIVSRELSPLEPAVVSVGSIKGGEAFNIIADKVTAVGTVRTLNNGLRRMIRSKIEKKAKNIASMNDAKCRVAYEKLGGALVNSNWVVELCRKAGECVLGKKGVAFLDKPSMGGEDFAEYLAFVPGCFIYLGTKKGTNAFPWHHERFDVDETALPKGSFVLAEIAKSFLK